MEYQQLNTFVSVARAGSITRAAELVHLSQPAVSAHIKSLEEELGLRLFARTARGMDLTSDGQRVLAWAERALAAHRELLDQAARLRGQVRGRLQLGACSSWSHAAIGHLLATLAERHPDVEVALRHGTSAEVRTGIADGSLDAGCYNDAEAPRGELEGFAVARFGLFVAARAGRIPPRTPPDWHALAAVPWILAGTSGCCSQAATALFQEQQFQPRRVLHVDGEAVTRTLIASGVGVGLLHEDAARAAQAQGEVDLVYPLPQPVRVWFAYRRSRAQDPLVRAVAAIVREALPPARAR